MFAFVKGMEFFLEPGNTLVLSLVAGACLLWTRWRQIGIYLTTAAAVVLLFLLFVPLAIGS